MITIYDNTLTQLGVISNYSKLTFRRQLRQAGQFELVIAKNKTGTENLDIGNIIAVDSTTCGIIVDKELTQTKNGQILTIRGTSLLGILAYRITR